MISKKLKEKDTILWTRLNRLINFMYWWTCVCVGVEVWHFISDFFALVNYRTSFGWLFQ